MVVEPAAGSGFGVVCVHDVFVCQLKQTTIHAACMLAFEHYRG